MINELVNQKKELETQIQELKAKRETLKEVDVETFIGISKLQAEIDRIEEQMKGIKAQQKSDNQNNIRNFLGTTFDNHTYVAGPTPYDTQMIPKSKSQLQIEYSGLIRALDDKLDKNEITDVQYDVVYHSLTTLFKEYTEELSQTVNQANKSISSQNQPQNIQPEFIDQSDEVVEFFKRETLRKKYGYYGRSSKEQIELDKIISQELHNVETDKNMESSHRRMM